MTTSITAILTTGLVVASAAIGVSAQQPIKAENTMTATATIQAIDSTTRTLTLRNEKGEEDSFTVSPEIKRFNEFKVGDKVRLTYHESVVLQVRKPDAAQSATLEAATAVGKGALPAGAAAAQAKMTVTVKTIDAAAPSITVTTPDGRTVTRLVQNKKYLDGVKVGDRIDITYTQAVVVNLERDK
jgi:Cu/Ag efflux protein CusF